MQCYLKDAAARIETDLRRADAEGWKFGAKTVRGAYMVVERARAAERGYESPIWDSLQETHNNYNRCGAVLYVIPAGNRNTSIAVQGPPMASHDLQERPLEYARGCSVSSATHGRLHPP